MSGSDGADFEVLFEDLDYDAGQWDTVSEVFAEAYSKTLDVVVPAGVFDGIAKLEGIDKDYHERRAIFVDIINDAQSEAKGVADALRATKQAYLESEDYAEWLAKRNGS